VAWSCIQAIHAEPGPGPALAVEGERVAQRDGRVDDDGFQREEAGQERDPLQQIVGELAALQERLEAEQRDEQEKREQGLVIRRGPAHRARQTVVRRPQAGRGDGDGPSRAQAPQQGAEQPQIHDLRREGHNAEGEAVEPEPLVEVVEEQALAQGAVGALGARFEQPRPELLGRGADVFDEGEVVAVEPDEQALPVDGVEDQRRQGPPEQAEAAGGVVRALAHWKETEKTMMPSSRGSRPSGGMALSSSNSTSTGSAPSSSGGTSASKCWPSPGSE